MFSIFLLLVEISAVDGSIELNSLEAKGEHLVDAVRSYSLLSEYC